jgi:hypothetical protein
LRYELAGKTGRAAMLWRFLTAPDAGVTFDQAMFDQALLNQALQ